MQVITFHITRLILSFVVPTSYFPPKNLLTLSCFSESLFKGETNCMVLEGPSSSRKMDHTLLEPGLIRNCFPSLISLLVVTPPELVVPLIMLLSAFLNL